MLSSALDTFSLDLVLERAYLSNEVGDLLPIQVFIVHFGLFIDNQFVLAIEAVALATNLLWSFILCAVDIADVHWTDRSGRGFEHQVAAHCRADYSSLATYFALLMFFLRLVENQVDEIGPLIFNFDLLSLSLELSP